MISAVILTYNSVNYIQSCLDSLLSQSHRGFELIVVDNGSQDETVNLIKRNYPQVILLENKENLGSARARNQGIEAAKGDWILTLDCDVVLEKDFLSRMVNLISGADKNIGVFQPKILNLDKETIYSCGIFLSRLRRFYDIGKGKKDKGNFEKPEYIFGACSAAAVYSRKMLESIKEETGYFDEKFFFLVEDVDLAWRARKNGWRAVFCPGIKCYHSSNSSGYDRKFRQYLCFRNRYYLIKKNEKINIIKGILLSLYDLPRMFYFMLTNAYAWRALKETKILFRYANRGILLSKAL